MNTFAKSFVLTIISLLGVLYFIKMLDNFNFYAILLPIALLIISLYFFFFKKNRAIGLGIFAGFLMVYLFIFIIIHMLEAVI